MTFTIREVDALDDDVLETLKRLHQVTLVKSPLPVFIQGFWWIAYHGDEPVAFAGLHASKQWIETGYLVRAGVLPAWRGNGLQRRLIRVREMKARSLGWSTLVVDTYGTLASSNNLIRAGYRLYEPQKPWSFRHALYWRKKI